MKGLLRFVIFVVAGFGTMLIAPLGAVAGAPGVFALAVLTFGAIAFIGFKLLRAA